jgi:hypothetical protein
MFKIFGCKSEWGFIGDCRADLGFDFSCGLLMIFYVAEWVIDCACKLGFMLSKNSLILEGSNWGFVVDILFKWYLDVLL